MVLYISIRCVSLIFQTFIWHKFCSSLFPGLERLYQIWWHVCQIAIYRTVNEMQKPVKTNLFLEMVLHDIKFFISHKCLARKPLTETNHQIFIYLFIFYTWDGISYIFKKFLCSFSDFPACELTQSSRLKV